MKLFILVLYLIFLSVSADIKVLSDFEGGSAKNIIVNENSVTLSPGGTGDRGFTCWWYVKLENVNPDEALKITVNAGGLKQSRGRGISSNWALPDRISYSFENINWKHSEKGIKSKSSSTWVINTPQKEMWVAWGAPYLPSHSKKLAERLKSAHCEPFTLCKTRENREVQAFKVTEPGVSSDRKVIWVQARQHAWEAGSSWVGEGFLEWITSDSKEALSLRQKSLIYYIPIMDVDNVATGNGGKEQHPHDHNRDWSEMPEWNSVAAAQKILKEHITEQRTVLFIDLHNPGPGDKETFLFLSPAEIQSDSNKIAQTKFIESLKKGVSGDLSFKGKVKVSGVGYHPLWKNISKTWFLLNSKESSSGVTIEVPWNHSKSLPDTYKKTGEGIARSVFSYLE